MLGGKLTCLAGIFAALTSAFRPFFPSTLSYHPIAEILTMVGLVGTFLGAIAWMVGYVVFAISFISGNDR